MHLKVTSLLAYPTIVIHLFLLNGSTFFTCLMSYEHHKKSLLWLLQKNIREVYGNITCQQRFKKIKPAYSVIRKGSEIGSRNVEEELFFNMKPDHSTIPPPSPPTHQMLHPSIISVTRIFNITQKRTDKTYVKINVEQLFSSKNQEF